MENILKEFEVLQKNLNDLPIENLSDYDLSKTALFIVDINNGFAKEGEMCIRDSLRSEECWDAFNCRAFVRVDFILSNGKFYVLELNTLPGMTKTSLIPRSANAKGISYSELIDKIIEYSL